MVISVGTTRSNGVVITLNLPGAQTYTYDPATQVLTQGAPEIAENTNPTGGIGIVVKKNPGSRARVIPVDGGSGTLPADLEDGTYDLIVRLPPSSSAAGTQSARMASRPAMQAAPVVARPVRLVFSLSVAGGRITCTGERVAGAKTEREMQSR